MVSVLTVTIAIFLVYLFLNSLNRILGSAVLVMFFAWAYPNLDSKLAGYYLSLLLVVLVFNIILEGMRVVKGEKASFFGVDFQGFGLIAINLVLGGALIFFASVLQGRSETAILGVPALAAVGTIATKFNAATSGMLGIVENKFLFTIYDTFKIFSPLIISSIPFLNLFAPVLIFILPIVIAVVFFSVLHITAYALAAGALFFAGLMMLIWIIGYESIGPLMADTFHYWWNAIINLGKSLRIVTSSGSGLEVI